MDADQAFRIQAKSCAKMGSPLYATLLEAAADDIASGGVTADLVAGWPGDLMNDAVPLRVMGAAHRLALSGAAPALAEHYPTAGGQPRGTVAATFVRIIEEHADSIRAALTQPPQTNEVGRAAILLGGLLEIAAILDQPMRLFEVGASAGLNLHLDQFSYDLGDARWGDPASPVRIVSEWRGNQPEVDRTIDVAVRRGCDIEPLDVRDQEAMIRLKSYVWADQLDRFERMTAAIEIARGNHVDVDRADAASWTARVAHPSEGATTVVYHTVVMQYLGKAARSAFEREMRTLGDAAGRQAPVAWLRFEPGQHAFEMRLTLLPHGIDVVLAEAQAHGAWVKWLPW